VNVEVLAVGTELLLGQITNTNAREIASRLADRGFTHRQQVVVGDNAERMAAAIEDATARADALIITGGIGPTQDDVTREIVAAVAGVDLVFDEGYAEQMRERWRSLGRDFPASNLRQAYRPEGSEIIENPKGSAPGFRIRVNGCWIASLPGVPAEMLPMLDDQVLPFLAGLDGSGAGVVVSRVIRSWGMSEASVGELFDDLFTGSENPTVAFLASAGEIKVRLTARAGNAVEAERLIAPVESVVRERLGRHCFGVDDDTIEVVVHRLLRAHGWTIGTAESATGGLLAARLTGTPGASATYTGSIIAYGSDAKRDVLGVPSEMMRDHGVVSEQTATAMARGLQGRLRVDVAVAITGSAGPDPLEEPVGTMCVAVVTPDTERARTFRMPGDRERVRAYTTTAALHQVRLALTAP
jgi:nicotinamide-nucleotide amidase